MPDPWTSRWNERFSGEAYAYGEEPNLFLKEQLDKLPPGKILFPAEGEGRNAVYAASRGWEAQAFDISSEGQKKALKLAEKKGVRIDYRVGELQTLGYLPGEFDVIALIYAHFPPAKRSGLHRSLGELVKPGGLVILEGFSKKHLEYLTKDEKVGGPRDIESLFSMEEMHEEFPGFDPDVLEETEIHLHEGEFHVGLGSVIRFVGRRGK
ncbi:MAG: class I SAM-dependent methyltransferase [Chitinophagaceae bacterium]